MRKPISDLNSPARQLGERFKARSTAFAEETQPVRDVLAESRTMKGAGAASMVKLAATGIEVAQDA